MFEKSTYINRRAALKKKGLKGLGIILGNREAPMNYLDNPYHFRQDVITSYSIHYTKLYERV